MKRNKIFKFLASIKLAVVLFAMFVVILGTATYYESAYDTATAQHLVYKSPFFALFLAVFFVNIFCSTAIRYPWKRKQFGFVLTHLAILILLASSAITMVWGVDGSLMVEEGQSGSRVFLNEPVFFGGLAGQPMKEVNAEFRWRAPSPERPSTVKLFDGIAVEVVRYLHHARPDITYVADPNGPPAVQLRIFNKRVDQRQWLTAGKGDLQLGPAHIAMLRANNPEHLQRLLQTSSDEMAAGEIQLLVDSEPSQVKVSELPEGKPMKIGGLELTLKRYLPHAVVENGKLVSRSKHPVNPCVELSLRDAAGNSQDWMLFGRMPELNTRTSSRGKLEAKVLYSLEAEAAGAPNSHGLTLIVGPSASGSAELWARVDGGTPHKVELDKPVATGWMDLQYEALALVPQAREVKSYLPFEGKKPEAQNDAPPAVLARIKGSDKPDQEIWLERGDVRQFQTADGRTFTLGYSYRSINLDFSVHLKDFKIDYDPGTTNPAAFKSDVEVDGKSALIQMNEPLVKSGYKIYQSSYSEIPGQPAVSIFTVAHDPALGLKYLGSILMTMGIAIMFWMRPYGAARAPRKGGPPPHSTT